jgi:hypothetical protein
VADGGLIDLDAVVSPDVRVKFDDVEYRLPGDAPSETLLRIQVISEQLGKAVGDTDVDKLLALREELSETLEELFSIKQDIEPGTINLSEKQIGELLTALFEHYYSEAEEAVEGGERPTPPTTRKPKSGQRSRASSRRAKRPATASQSSTSSPT